MASIDIDIIHGDHLVKPPAQTIDFSSVNRLPLQYTDIERVTLSSQHGVPVYLIKQSTGSIIINASSGQTIDIDQQYIERHARDIYAQQGRIISTALLTQYPSELGGRQQPIWQVTFDDSFNPTLYFSPLTGQFIKARSDLWRLFDLMWILHIMDYDEGEDVNNLLLTFASMLALLMACSGAWLIFYSFNQREGQSGFLSVLRASHKWLSLLVGIQLILWVSGGIVFNVIQAKDIHLTSQLNPQAMHLISAKDIDFAKINQRYSFASSVTISATPTAALVSFDQQSRHPKVRLDNLEATYISQQQALNIASQVYRNDASIAHSELVTPQQVESRKLKRTLWQVVYQDSSNSTLYIDALTGQALDIKNDQWRIKDWFWMLHIMDYSTRSDFNSPLLITISSIASLFALSGLLMLFYVISRASFGVGNKAKQHQVSITSNQQPPQNHQVTGGQPLLHALQQQGFDLPSGCGGGGTCCQCMVIAKHSTAPLTTQEQSSLSLGEMNQGCRLACQLQVTEDITIALSDQAANQQTVSAKVMSNRFETPFIIELVVQLPPNHGFSFAAGQYVNIDIPPFDLTIGPTMMPPEYQRQWQASNIIEQRVSLTTTISRSYSIASNPGNSNTLTFNIRLALPRAGYGMGIASSYLCHLRAGDNLSFAGPLGDFTTELHSAKELILIGAGAGMAPLKSHIDTLLSQRSSRKISLWFGAREQADIFYQSHFDALARRHANFKWHVSLSRPIGDTWQGNRGHIQNALFSQYLNHHGAKGDIEFLLCGPSIMMGEISKKLQRLGITRDAIKCDEFG